MMGTAMGTKRKKRGKDKNSRRKSGLRGVERLPASYRTLKPGLHGDGGCLYLQVSDGDSGNRRKSWIFRYQLAGQRRRDMGLGSLADVTLSEARETAREYRKLVKQGLDPIDERNKTVAQNLAARTAVMTFDQAAEAYLRQHRSGWKSTVHAEQWAASVRAYASPVLGRMGVANIDTGHVMKVLEPIWQTKTETASRVRGRIEAVLGWAAASGYRPKGENPARWHDHLDQLLARPSKIKKVKHTAALDYRKMADFLVALRARRGVPSLALQFTIFTCVRSEDVRNARWAHIDRASRTWTIPAFSKTGVEHKVPLSTAALAVLDKVQAITGAIGGTVSQSEFIFPNDVTGARLSTNGMLCVIDRMGLKGEITAHGCRASFRTWAQEETNFPWELAELSLGHTVGTKVERAYARGDAFKKRVAIMQSWANYCSTPRQPGTVIPLAKAVVP